MHLSSVDGIFMNMLPGLIVFNKVVQCLPERICFLLSISVSMSKQKAEDGFPHICVRSELLCESSCVSVCM